MTSDNFIGVKIGCIFSFGGIVYLSSIVLMISSRSQRIYLAIPQLDEKGPDIVNGLIGAIALYLILGMSCVILWNRVERMNRDIMSASKLLEDKD